MYEIIYNLALIHALNYCKEHKIDPTGTYLNKKDRKFIYTLTKQVHQVPVVTVEFHKRSVPTYIVH